MRGQGHARSARCGHAGRQSGCRASAPPRAGESRLTATRRWCGSCGWMAAGCCGSTCPARGCRSCAATWPRLDSPPISPDPPTPDTPAASTGSSRFGDARRHLSKRWMSPMNTTSFCGSIQNQVPAIPSRSRCLCPRTADLRADPRRPHVVAEAQDRAANDGSRCRICRHQTCRAGDSSASARRSAAPAYAGRPTRHRSAASARSASSRSPSNTIRRRPRRPGTLADIGIVRQRRQRCVRRPL